jgi:hypothetical protein
MTTSAIFLTARTARIVHWRPGMTWRHQMEADVPSPTRPGDRTTQEPVAADSEARFRRAFFAQVSRAVSRDDAVLVLGELDLITAFAAFLVADDRAHDRDRRIMLRASGPLTDRQLLNRVRAFAGPRRAGPSE